MSTTLYRGLASADVEVRTVAGKRELRGIVVPFNLPTRIDATLTESFAPTAFARQLAAPNRIPLFREHEAHGGTLIGRALELRADAAGLYGAFRVAPTTAGDEALALVTDEALSHWSIGFREGQNRALPGGIVERSTATLTEVALVLRGAYGDEASVAEIRGQVERVRLDEARQILAGLPMLPA
jgi:HK97 family phage prohead protease